MAATGNGEVSLHVEAEVVAQSLSETLEGPVGYLDDDSAHLADEVVMGVIGKVVDGWAVPEVDVVDHSEAFQLVKEPVHRGLVDVGLARLHIGGELFRGRVSFVVDERPEDGAARTRHAPARGSEEVENFL